MHNKAKQRILYSENKTDDRQILVLEKVDYENFKGAVARLCENIINSSELTNGQKEKVAWLRSRIDTEM